MIVVINKVKQKSEYRTNRNCNPTAQNEWSKKLTVNQRLLINFVTKIKIEIPQKEILKNIANKSLYFLPLYTKRNPTKANISWTPTSPAPPFLHQCPSPTVSRFRTSLPRLSLRRYRTPETTRKHARPPPSQPDSYYLINPCRSTLSCYHVVFFGNFAFLFSFRSFSLGFWNHFWF